MSWTVTSGSLPPGLALNTAYGVIAGMPTTAGTYSFTVQAANTSGSNSKVFSLTVNGVVSQPAPPPAPSGATAQFVRTDTTTQGGWPQSYGSDGYMIANQSTALPSYAQADSKRQIN